MNVCIAENRKSCEIGVKFLLLSLAKHVPHLPIFLYYPPADEEFACWMSKYNTNVIHEKRPIPDWKGWNVKPSALLTLLESGHNEVLWIDSDIIITRDFQYIFSGLSFETIAVAEEALVGGAGGHELGYLDKGGFRAKMWGFKVERALPFTANSGVIRVTTKHIPLLYEWKKLLETDDYRNTQNSLNKWKEKLLKADGSKRTQYLDWPKLPLHMISDQDVLTALLSSQKFSHHPIRFLRRGKDIIQYFGMYGYTTAERIRNMISRLPPFVHSNKPFLRFREPDSGDRRHRFESLYIDVSPYTLIATSFRDNVETDCPWMEAHSHVAAALRALGLWYAPAVGLPIALLADTWRIGKRIYSITSKLAFGTRI